MSTLAFSPAQRQYPSHLCMAYLKFPLLAFKVGFQSLDVLEMGTALVLIVFLVMLALHDLLISFAELLLMLDRRTSTQQITTCTTPIA